MLVGILWIIAFVYAAVNLRAHFEKFFKYRSDFIEHYDNAGNHISIFDPLLEDDVPVRLYYKIPANL